ncbi:3'-5' exonuclease [Usitatibacter palustris]|uniref:DNA 3'-5' helicase n=1 Tax=Usitatibacter palustris TaxID=2732487 RepID=A0A6M4H5I7_9PROT|nr:3'-5' exonuclease [Usitatibacter palustris]QJR14750.1 ATP-dependent DNA helicase Rep [Usitatibacter palustris]
MKALLSIKPTPEQLKIFARVRPGVEVIRGAAGSGKTTTAILKLQANLAVFLRRKDRMAKKPPVRVLVLTFNRTLKGYLESLVRAQAAESEKIEITIDTFAHWARDALDKPAMVADGARKRSLQTLGSELGLGDFLIEETDYLTGRFLSEKLESYTTTPREGRGNTPRVDKALRERLLSEVVVPYDKWKRKNNVNDWNDLALALAKEKLFEYDIVVVDETQDFSANQVRAVMNQLADVHSVTFILDTAQRIYPRGFKWQEVGIVLRPENSHRLERNYRNTKQIAAFAASMLAGVEADDDYTIPDLERCEAVGPKPILLEGKYSAQVGYALGLLAKSKIDLKEDSVAFLHPKGGGWFDYLRAALSNKGLPFVELTREAEWPKGPENIALSTMHSAKGLEFDHVFILGVNAGSFPEGEFDPADDRQITARKLVAMAVSRARKSVIVGFKADDRSALIDYFDKPTYTLVKV